MATRPPPECPLCHDGILTGQGLEEHLLQRHSKRALAKFVVAEATLHEADVSE